MFSQFKVGEIAQLWYAERKRCIAVHQGTSLHARHCKVLVLGKGPGPRNALVTLREGIRVVVSQGNLRKASVA